jgi:lipoprotein-releasing system permease protein
MGYPLRLAIRYLGASKRASISVGTAIAVAGVVIGVSALLTVMSVTGGFQAQFREKVLGVNAHVLVLKHSTEFRNYRDIMERVREVPGVVNVAPFSINPMMLAHGERTATGVLVKGVDPKASLGVGLDPGVPPVLDLPRHVVRGEAGECPKPVELECGIRMLEGLRRAGAIPPPPKVDVPSVDENGQLLPSPPKTVGSGAFLPPPGSTGAAPAWLVEAEERHAAAKNKVSASSRPPTLPPVPDLRSPGTSAPAQAKSPGDDVKIQAAPSETTPPGASPKRAKDEAKDAAAKQGDVTPKGGYESVLPDDDDVVLDEISPKDPCDDPQAIKSLPGIVIGVSLAENLDLKLGDCVTVTSPTIGFQFSGGAIKAPVAKSFRVMAMFEAGFDQYDSKLVYTDLFEAQHFYDEGDTVTGVEMKIGDIDSSDVVVESVKKALPPGAYRIMDWKELNHGLFTALLIQQIGMSAVLALIILVAAFAVVAILIMVVLDKKREISVLKAMGATDFGILRVFLYQGGFIGGLGTTLGLLLGFINCQILRTWAFPLDPKVYFISQLPVLMRWQEFAITGAVAVSLCLLATIIPSLYAANIRPADGFRDQG